MTRQTQVMGSLGEKGAWLKTQLTFQMDQDETERCFRWVDWRANACRAMMRSLLNELVISYGKLCLFHMLMMYVIFLLVSSMQNGLVV